MVVFGGSIAISKKFIKDRLSPLCLTGTGLRGVLDICPSLILSAFDRIVTAFLTHGRVDSSGLKLITGRRSEWLIRLDMDSELKDLRIMKEPYYWALDTLHVRLEVVVVIADMSQHYKSSVTLIQTISTPGFRRSFLSRLFERGAFMHFPLQILSRTNPERGRERSESS